MPNALLYQKLKYLRYGSHDVKLNCRFDINGVKVKYLSMLEDGTSCFHEGKIIDNDGEEVLACCEKPSKDSVELAGLCEAVIFLHRGSYVCGLSCYRDIALDIGSTDCEDQEKLFLVTYASN